MIDRDVVKDVVKAHQQELYGIDGAEITIEEHNLLDNLLFDAFHQEDRHIPKPHPFSEQHKEKIRKAKKGLALSEQAKQRLIQNSQRVNVYQYALSGELVNVWQSTRQIEREIGYNNSLISKVCRGQKPSAYGYRWKYKPIGSDAEAITITVKKMIKG